VANVTKISQTVTSTTAGTLVVTTGAGTGTLTISDGFETTTVRVSARHNRWFPGLDRRRRTTWR
jgi:hypothetical protein